MKDFEKETPILLGERIKTLRKKYDLSLAKFGELVGLSKGTVHRIETGTNFTTTKTLNTISEVFKVDVDYLLGKSDEPDLNQKSYKRFKEIKERLDQLPQSDQDLVLQQMLSMTQYLLEQRSKSIEVNE